MKRWTRVVVVAALVLGALGLPAAPVAADDWPETWSPRVARIAREVERIRKLRFVHPVPVDFQRERDFLRDYDRMNRRTRGPDRDEVAATEAMLQALDLLGEGESLPGLIRDAGRAQTAAYYDPVRRRVLVRGRDLGPYTELVLAHELTHVLQDQHFGAKRLLSDGGGLDGSIARRGLLEGDATQVMQRYAETMPAASARRALDSEVMATRLSARTREPWAQFALGGAPYDLGPLMVRALREAPGGLRRAYQHPPRHQVELLNPVTILDPEPERNVPLPDLRPGERRVGQIDTVGAITLYAGLAQHLDVWDALRAADEWRGASAVVFRRDGVPCIRANFRTVNKHASARLLAALQRWVEVRPAGTASAVPQGDVVVAFESCGAPSTRAPVEKLGDAIGQAGLRNLLVTGSVNEGPDITAWKCLWDRVLVDPLYTGLLKDMTSEPGELEPAQERRVERIFEDLGLECDMNPYAGDPGLTR